MKNVPLILLIFVALISCESPEADTELESLQMKNDSLENQLVMKDSTIRLFEESFTSIQQNLSLISDREKSISLSAGELRGGGEDTREEITRDIQAINNLLEENKKTIGRLNQKLAKSGSEVTSFKKLIAQLNEDIETKEEEVSYLKENLTAANFTIEILNEMLDSAEFRNEIQSDLIQMQSDEINTVYYAIGSFKDLEEAGVVEKKGGIVGLAGSKQLKSDFNKDFFAEINLTRTRLIPVNSEKVNIVTAHPPETYELIGEDEKTLKILEPTRFWEASKYLVIITD
ncbi:MAG: hypothetical protein ACJAQ4_000861 [Cryomorphaceae bacterium]|jgi:hypothetical protein